MFESLLTLLLSQLYMFISLFSPIEKQMRKNELQSRIRQLRNDNTTLSTLISHMDIEWKEVITGLNIKENEICGGVSFEYRFKLNVCATSLLFTA